ncbi:MAG TPA: bifunctional homocysteine S-methyltransferase/methylenetetrahydrofolate reductase [Chthoniobacterales bacterium]
MNFLEELGKRVIGGDGAMGTLLMERGIALNQCFEEICLSNPELVRGVHRDYAAAGAELIETNSFGANAVRLARHGLQKCVGALNRQAAQIARQAVHGAPAWVAGSVGPLGLTPAQAEEQGIDRAAVFREQIAALIEGGVDVLLFETFQSLDELRIALRAKAELSDCPAIGCLTLSEGGRLADGATLTEAFRQLADAQASVVGINCVSGPQAAIRLLENVESPLPLAVYPNAGRPRLYEGRYVYDSSPEYFAESAQRLAELGANLVGGCCGTTPAHIAAISRQLKSFGPPVKPRKKIAVVEREKIKLAVAGDSILDRLKAGKTVIVTELDPPKTLTLDRYFEAAEKLTEAGSDAITLADNSLAILRVSNLAIGAMLKARGIEPLLHLSCRDKNVLGLQSELMGAAAMGIRHILPLTGDPAKVGDHPGATSVYDVNSIGLLEIARRMNEGYTQAGTDLKKLPGFVMGCTFNPNAKNLDAQISRLQRKINAGAQYVLTQPVFDAGLVRLAAEKVRHFNIPIFFGVWPILNGRQAKFLHNEVPGIRIPEPVLAEMEGLEGAEGRRHGIAIAKEVCRAALDEFPCVYLITPFQVYETTAELAEFVRGRT